MFRYHPYIVTDSSDSRVRELSALLNRAVSERDMTWVMTTNILNRALRGGLTADERDFITKCRDFAEFRRQKWQNFVRGGSMP